ncbi:hypothetical protein L484_014361 [Morus notabilis]|uniref:Uncharacterized protein n=1 Tax=Morus notabilis TaxID=981085 RepID=W9RKF9_9ROSA|nr:hypothetical protein L484_014361 [Morus notabilis]
MRRRIPDFNPAKQKRTTTHSFYDLAWEYYLDHRIHSKLPEKLELYPLRIYDTILLEGIYGHCAWILVDIDLSGDIVDSLFVGRLGHPILNLPDLAIIVTVLVMLSHSANIIKFLATRPNVQRANKEPINQPSDARITKPALKQSVYAREYFISSSRLSRGEGLVHFVSFTHPFGAGKERALGALNARRGEDRVRLAEDGVIGEARKAIQLGKTTAVEPVHVKRGGKCSSIDGL